MERVFFDQCGNQLTLHAVPLRIISLVPSQTELLFDLGVDEEVVGITRYCVHPTHWKSGKTLIGGTKKFDFEIIDSLKPDLIIGNKEENYKEGIELLQQKYPVWMSDIFSFQDALEMIAAVGVITNRVNQAKELVSSISNAFLNLQKWETYRALYLIWRKPWMAAASNTFIDAMLQKLGLVNALKNLERYPELKSEEIAELNPDLILLSSEPYPFSEKHIEEIKTLCPSSKILLVDGEMFSWYGSRLKQAPAYFNSLVSQPG